MQSFDADVVIAGAGPGGSTCGAFLRKHNPNLRVTILEREQFPRDHVGESQLPVVCQILQELGVWDRVEESGFPIKVGATFRWGNSDDLWDFDFLPYGRFEDAPRPAKFEGQRSLTAFQVDRAVYDKILADYAQDLGCEVRYRTAVRGVEKDGDAIQALVLEDGSRITARYYVDATGHSGLIRRQMGVEIEEPTSLKNIAIWDYWRNAEWADSIGIGGTRVQILSLGYGWIWFIPIAPDRTSIGLVCPAGYYKSSGVSYEDLYMRALGEEPRLQKLIRAASRENHLSTTKDWSFVAKRMTGKNWFLVGEAAGFADPILAAGLSLTQTGAKELAFLILEAMRGGDEGWMCAEYERRNEQRVRQHIRFADYWYGANANFSDLKQYTAEIAKDAGIEMSADEAFRWLGTGGFIEEDLGVAGTAFIRLDALEQIAGKLSQTPVQSALHGHNLFLLNVAGAEEIKIARFVNGGVGSVAALKRDGKILPMIGHFAWTVKGLRHTPRLDQFFPYVAKEMKLAGKPFTDGDVARLTDCLEAMVRDGWVQAKVTKDLPPLRHELPLESDRIYKHVDRG